MEWIKVEDRLPVTKQRCLVYVTIYLGESALEIWKGIADAGFSPNIGWKFDYPFLRNDTFSVSCWAEYPNLPGK